MKKSYIIVMVAITVLQGCGEPANIFTGTTTATESQKELIKKGMLDYLSFEKGCKSIDQIDVTKDKQNRENWDVSACGIHVIFSVKPDMQDSKIEYYLVQ